MIALMWQLPSPSSYEDKKKKNVDIGKQFIRFLPNKNYETFNIVRYIYESLVYILY